MLAVELLVLVGIAPRHLCIVTVADLEEFSRMVASWIVPCLAADLELLQVRRVQEAACKISGAVF